MPDLEARLVELSQDGTPRGADAIWRAANRHLRRRRVARVSALVLTVAILVASITVVAVRGGKDAVNRPFGSTAPTATATTFPPFVQPQAVRLPATDRIPELSPASSVVFPWGTATGSAGVDQALSGATGPAIAKVDDAGNVLVFDQVNWRIVARASDGSLSTAALDAPKELAQSAVFDGDKRLIVAGARSLMVFAPDGRLNGRFPFARFPGLAKVRFVHWLQVHGSDVVMNEDNTEWIVLTDTADGYAPNYSVKPAPAAVRIQGNYGAEKTVLLTDEAADAAFNVGGPFRILFIPAVRLLPDGSIVAVFHLYLGNDGAPTDTPETYIVVRIQADGTTQVGRFEASSGYLDQTGPVVAPDDDGLSVLSSTTTAGATVARYPYSDLQTTTVCAAGSEGPGTTLDADVDGDGRPDRVYYQYSSDGVRLGVCTASGTASEVTGLPGQAESIAIVRMPGRSTPVVLAGETTVGELLVSPYVIDAGSLRKIELNDEGPRVLTQGGQDDYPYRRGAFFGCDTVESQPTFVQVELTKEPNGMIAWKRTTYVLSGVTATAETSHGTIDPRETPLRTLASPCTVVAEPGNDLTFGSAIPELNG